MKYEFPVYLNYEDRVFTILGYVDDIPREYVHNKAYINNNENIVCVYTEKPDDISERSVIPYFWMENNSIKYSELTPKMYKNFGIENIKDLSKHVIEENTIEGEKLYDDELIISINNSTSVFKPEINETDDFLKKVIKQVILNKNVDIKILENKLGKKNGLNNLKSALTGTTKMSTTNFIIWAELLGIEWEVKVSNNGIDKICPLEQTLIYKSNIDKVIEEE